MVAMVMVMVMVMVLVKVAVVVSMTVVPRAADHLPAGVLRDADSEEVVGAVHAPPLAR